MERTRWVKQGMLWAVCLVMVFCAVSAQAISIPEVVGRWYIVAAKKGNRSSGLSGEAYIELNRDRSVTMMVDETAVNTDGMTWKIYTYGIAEFNDGVEINSSEGKRILFLEYDGTKLSCLTENVSTFLGLPDGLYEFTLSREAIHYDTPEAQKAEKEDQFFGEYEHYLSVTGEEYTEVDRGGRIIKVAEYVLTETADDQTKEYLTDFKEGVLHVYASDEWIYSVTSDPDVLVAYQAADETGAHLYFRRTGSEETQE